MAVFNDRGQICALGMSSKDFPPILKYNDESWSYWSEDIFSKPVVSSRVAPVADLYLANASEQ
jgi:hypothetical protein